MGVRVALGAVLLTTACGSSGPATPAEQCTDLGTSLCTRDAECAVTVGTVSQSQSGEFVTNCEASFRASAGCSQVTQVTGDPAACVSDFRAEPCSAFAATGLPVPDTCVALFR